MKVGLFGIGYWGRRIYSSLTQRTDIEDVVVVDSRGDPNLILEDDQIENVFIATPVNTHYALCMSAIRAGKNVMCEKNLAPTIQTSEDIVSEASLYDRSLLVDFIYAFNPELPLLGLGEHDRLTVTMHQHGRFRDEDVMSILGSHALAVANEVVGLHRAENIWSYEVSPSYPRRSVVAGFALDSGAILIVDVSVDASEKIRTIQTRDITWQLDYDNGIDLMIEKFLSGEDNSVEALLVAECLEQTRMLC